MPRSTKDPSQGPLETPAGLRTMAAHARRLARNTTDEEASFRLNEFADELEARAAALETAPQSFSHEEAAAVQRTEDDTDPERN